MRLFIIGFCLFCTGLASRAEGIAPQGALHPSLRLIGTQLQEADKITGLYRSSLKHPETVTAQKLEALEKKNLKALEEFKALAAQSATFVRGEIENEQVLSQILALLQFSMLRVRFWEASPGSQNLRRIRDEVGAWFQFAAELAYNESSLVGLKTSGVIRSLLLDELEGIEERQGRQLARSADWLRWLQGLRTPWPVDRVLLSEGRRYLSSASVGILEKAAARIQKNPYLSVEEALDGVPGGKPKELDALKAFWTSKDMMGLKTEVTRLEFLRLVAAKSLFLERQKRAPVSVKELVQLGFLASEPIDYLTGKAMILPQTDMPFSGRKSP